MNRKVYLDNYGFINLTDQNYIASGGEASVYKYSNYALKIYHDKTKCIEEEKIKELSLISSNNVLKPINLIYDEKKKYIGYSMDYAPDTEPICKLFTKNFKYTNNISINDITELVKDIQKSISEIHKSNCLVVDLNEMNILSDNSFKKSIFIDVDSYQTKNFKATAIMESIRDRTVKNDNWTELSDWYSFAIIAFQLYIGIHPYKGKHPSYKANEWIKRMDDNISVFDKNVSLPSVCESFSIIPQKYLDWFKALFVNGIRELPPILDQIQTSIINPISTKIIHSNQNFTISEIITLNERILEYKSIFGVNYFITNKGWYKENKFISDLQNGSNITYTNINEPIICNLENQKLSFKTQDMNVISNISATNYYVLENKVFSLFENNLIESSFLTFGKNHIHKTKNYQVSYASKLYDGCIIQDLLDKKYITFIENDLFINIQIKELECHRILEVVRKKNFAVIIAEKNGYYDRFIIHFDFKNTFNIKYEIRISNNVDYNNINFTVLDNGIAILLVEDEKIEVFRDNSTIKLVDNSPFNHSMKLISSNNNVYFIDNNKLFNLKLK
jgi:hypothetical protein